MTRLPTLPNLTLGGLGSFGRASSPMAELFAPPPTMPRRRAQHAPLTPEEERSLLGKAMGGVEYFGSSLDKPGSALRGLLAGDPEQLLNLIPFSDAMGLTDPHDRVSGRELLEQWGIAPKNIPGMFNSWEDTGWDVGGFAAEVVLDPLNLLGVGVLTQTAKATAKAARAASPLTKTMPQALKLMEKTLASGRTNRIFGTTGAETVKDIAEGTRAFVGIRVPFTTYALASFGKGEKAAAAYKAMAYNPVTAPIRLMFSHTLKGQTIRPAEQYARDLAYSELLRTGMGVQDIAPTAMRSFGRLEGMFNDVLKHGEELGDPQTFNALTRELLEAKDGLPDLGALYTKIDDTLMNSGGKSLKELGDRADGFVKEYYEFMDGVKQINQMMVDKSIELGASRSMLDSIFTGYFPRRKTTDTGVYKLLARQDVLDLPGGSRTVDDISRDPRFTALGGRDKAAMKELDGDLHRWLDTNKPDVTHRKMKNTHIRAKLSRDFGIEMEFNASRKELVAQLKEVAPNINPNGFKGAALRGRVMFDTHIHPALRRANAEGVIDDTVYEQQIVRFLYGTPAEMGKQAGKPVMDDLARHMASQSPDILETGMFSRPVIADWFDYMEGMGVAMADMQTLHHWLSGPGIVTQGKGTKTLRKAWSDVKGVGGKKLLNGQGLDHLGRRLAKTLGVTLDETDPKALKTFIDGLTVDERVAQAIKVHAKMQTPEITGPMLSLWDKVNSVFRGAYTTGFPAFHGRNLFAGVIQNLCDPSMNSPADVPALIKANLRLLGHYFKGTPIDYGEEMIQFGLQKARTGHLMETVQGVGKEAMEGATDVVEGGPRIVANILDPRHWDRYTFHPGAWRGGWPGKKVVGGKKDIRQNVVAELGEVAYGLVEFLNRGSMYTVLRNKGFSPSEALHRVNIAQFDYSKTSVFTQKWLKRATLFPIWMQKNLSLQVKRLVSRPGGPTAQTIRAMRVAREDTGAYTPAFLREGMAIPVGKDPAEMTFIKQFGAPVEDLNNVVFQGAKVDKFRTFGRFAAMLHPLITFPLERFSGRQFYTGREVKHLRQHTPYPWMNALIHATPASRVFGEAAKLTDERKNIAAKMANIATGFKIATYDVEKWKLIEAQDVLRRRVEADPSIRVHERPYVPKHLKPEADPETMHDLDILKRLEADMRRLKGKREAEGRR